MIEHSVDEIVVPVAADIEGLVGAISAAIRDGLLQPQTGVVSLGARSSTGKTGSEWLSLVD